ncbi:conjugal transfer protein [Streptomyces sp. NPDC006879]|uniref:conjugal transfer protein n=1 Tax=Streptomyces sp. NPDC006879 TaxID=3364767 RepID=UPI0036844824
MTDHNSSAGGVAGGQPAQFTPAEQGGRQQGGEPDPYPATGAHPVAPALSPEAVRAQVAAAWVRNAPHAAVPAAEAAVPALPPRAQGPAGSSKKAQREQAKSDRRATAERKRSERKAAQEHKKRAGRGREAAGGGAPEQSGAPGPGAAFEVPRPGGRLPSQGRTLHVALRATLLVTGCLFALGSCGVMGLVVGTTSKAPTAAALDAKDVSRYRLTDFPTRSAATFAEEYATLCMTYAPADVTERREELARYVSTGVDRDCGWNGQGVQRVKNATWDGSIEELPEYGKHGRYLGIQVKLTNGRSTTLSVPVYVADLTGGTGLRIAGDVGEMPLPEHGSAPLVDRDEESIDHTLSDELKAKVLPGYFTAWGVSDATAMARFLTADASAAATSGLAGALQHPQIRDVQALAPAGSDQTEEVTYRDGQAVPVRVTVLWGGSAKGGSKPSARLIERSYRVTVVNTAQGWFIKDVRGGLLDPTGGRADGAEPGAPDASDTSEPSDAPETPQASPGRPKSAKSTPTSRATRKPKASATASGSSR